MTWDWQLISRSSSSSSCSIGRLVSLLAAAAVVGQGRRPGQSQAPQGVVVGLSEAKDSTIRAAGQQQQLSPPPPPPQQSLQGIAACQQLLRQQYVQQQRKQDTTVYQQQQGQAPYSGSQPTRLWVSCVQHTCAGTCSTAQLCWAVVYVHNRAAVLVPAST